MKTFLAAINLSLLLAVSAGAETLTMACSVISPEIEDAFTKVYRAAGYELEIRVVPPARVVYLVELGLAADFAVTEDAIDTAFRTAVVRVGIGDDPITTLPVVGWVRKGEEQRWLGEAVHQARVGYVFGSPTSARVAESAHGRVLLQAPSYEAAARMLFQGRFDIMFAAQGVGEPVFDKQNFACVEGPSGPLRYWHVLPAAWRGTEIEKRLRAAFLKEGKLVTQAFQDFSRRARPEEPVLWK